jgi:hydrogenase maturation protease
MKPAPTRHALIIGYGNTDRQDDGVAWHVLAALRRWLGRPDPATDGEAFEPEGANPDFLFTLQLTPEMAETLAEYERICFVDAHTGNVPEKIHVSQLEGKFQRSPFTHHLTADTLMALCAQLYSHTPDAILVSLRGYQFGFERSLSPETQALVEPAAREILAWLGVDRTGAAFNSPGKDSN